MEKYIQIDGIYFPNKGDELMFRAICSEVREQSDEYLAVYGNGKGSPEPHIIREEGAFQLARLKRFGFNFDRLFSDIRLYRHGLLREFSSKIILDSGGFQFGDQWHNRYSKRYINHLNRYLNRCKKSNIKIVLLPQAFGPFENPLSKQVIRLYYEYVQLIFARDKQSFDYLSAAVNDKDKLRISPDFTNLLCAGNCLIPEIKGEFVVIIPNYKMITHTSSDIGRDYIKFLHDLSIFLTKKDLTVIYLNHESINDHNIIVELQKRLDCKTLYFPGLNAKQIKRIISDARLLISSRYHGAVSGLCQGVLTFCTSWSHKYIELLNDYNCGLNLLDTNNLKEAMDKINLSVNKKTKSRNLNVTIENEKLKSRKMWGEVFALMAEQ